MDKKTSKRLSWIGLEALYQFIRPVANTLISLFVVRLASPELWGAVVPFILGIEVLLQLVHWGHKPFLLRIFSEQPGNLNKNWYTHTLQRTVLTLPILILLYFIPGYSTFYGWLAAWFLLRFLVLIIDVLIQYHRRYYRALLAEVISLSTVILGLLYFFDALELTSILILFVLAQAFKALFLIGLIPKFRLHYTNHLFSSNLLIPALPFFLLGFVGLLQNKVDLYSVTWLLNDSDIAFYQILVSFLVLGQTLSTTVLNPFQKNLYRMSYAEIKKMKLNYFLFGLSLSFLVAIGITLVLKLLYHFEVSLTLSLFMWFYLAPMYYYLIECQIILKNHQEVKLIYFNLIATFVSVIGTFVLIPLLHIEGAILASIIGRCILTLLVVRFVQRKMST